MDMTRDRIQVSEMHVHEKKMVNTGLFFVRIVELGFFAPPKLSPVGLVSMTHRTSELAHFRLVVACSTNTSVQYCALNSRMNRGSLELSLRIPVIYKQEASYQSSLAMPKSLQHLMRALLLHDSVAVATPEGSKNSCSPRAIATNLSKSLETVKFSNLRYMPSKTNESVFTADDFRTDIGFSSRGQSPASRAKRLV